MDRVTIAVRHGSIELNSGKTLKSYSTMGLLQNWQAIAYNQSTDSENRIHSDEVAKAYGFKGGLVPGVTVSSYLMHPAVEAFGMGWLTSGHAHVVVKKPLYDNYAFEVNLSDVTKTSYQASLSDQEKTTCAIASICLKDEMPVPPSMRGDPLLKRDQKVPNATREEMQQLQDKGMYALPARWNDNSNMASYLKDRSAMPALLNFNSGSYANGAYMLGLTNWVLAGNAYMNPWIHLETESQNFAAVENNTDLIVECNIEKLFEKKGHEFVDLNVDIYIKETAQCAMTAKLRAIYQLRGAT